MLLSSRDFFACFEFVYFVSISWPVATLVPALLGCLRILFPPVKRPWLHMSGRFWPFFYPAACLPLVRFPTSTGVQHVLRAPPCLVGLFASPKLHRVFCGPRASAREGDMFPPSQGLLCACAFHRWGSHTCPACLPLVKPPTGGVFSSRSCFPPCLAEVVCTAGIPAPVMATVFIPVSVARVLLRLVSRPVYPL